MRLAILNPDGSIKIYPASLNDLNEEFPDVNFVNGIGDLSSVKDLPSNLVEVLDGELPSWDKETQVISTSKPILKNGTYYESYSVRAMTKAELEERANVVKIRSSTIDDIQKYKAKVAKNQKLADLKITSSLGNVFDADTKSINAISNRINTLDNDTTTAKWKLANNNVLVVTKKELVEVFTKACEEVEKIITE